MPSHFPSTVRNISKMQRILSSLFCSLFFFRRTFCIGVDDSIDSGWTWALNRTIHEGKMFGRDFVFTYGPLGFLSTRFTMYVGGWPLLLGDLTLAVSFFFLCYQYLLRDRFNWLMVAAAVIVLRDASFIQAVFVLFLAFNSSVILDKTAPRMFLVLCGMLGGLLFFIKVNYGVTVPFLLLLPSAVMTMRQNWGSLLTLWGGVIVVAAPILLLFPINIPAYVCSAIPLIGGYEEAMFLPVDVNGWPYITARVLLAPLLIALSLFGISIWRKKRLQMRPLLVVVSTCLSAFLLYKNGFTRFDEEHYRQFFATYPFLFTVAVILLGGSEIVAGRLLAIATTLIAAINLVPVGPTVNVAEEVWSRVSIYGYYSRLLDTSASVYPRHLQFCTEKRAAIGDHTIDIIPHELSVAACNGLAYAGRPVPQSYSVYDRRLDSLNERYFTSRSRPEKVLLASNVVDPYRYAPFYEPLTKAAIHVNYNYETTTLPGDSIASSNNDYFLLFEQVAGRYETPRFTWCSSIDCQQGDTVLVPDAGVPIYMSADMQYSLTGMLHKLLVQPMPVWITFYMEDGQYYDYRLLLPLARAPVPISRLISNNRELWLYMAGRATQLRKIRGIRITTPNLEIKKQIRLTFYSFDNYRQATG